MNIQMTKWVMGAALLGMTAGAALGEEAAAPAGHTNKLSGSVFVYCAAGVKEPLSELAKGFEADTGVKVDMTFANTGQLLGQIEMTHKGDVYVPGDIGFARKAQEKNLVSGQPREFCYFVPAILVRKGNPKEVKDVQDLTKPGMKLALADPSAAIGKLQADVFKKNGLDEAALKTNTSVSPATVTDVALAVKMGTVDAGIVWDAIGRMYSADADMVAIPAEKNVIGTVAATVLAGSKNPAAANAFLVYLTSDKGKAILKAKGYTVELPASKPAGGEAVKGLTLTPAVGVGQ